jgi:hypothetical protein
MSDLSRRLHAVAAEPTTELDTDALVSRIARRRRRRAIAVSAAALVVVLAASGGVLAARGPSRGDLVRTTGGDTDTTLPPPSVDSSTTSSPSSTAAPGNSIPRTTLPPGRSGPWQASPTTGLRNYDTVTITATGLEPGSYVSGQCPASSALIGDTTRCTIGDMAGVTDGTLTVHVRVVWWMKDGLDCASASGICVVGFMSTNPKSTFKPVSFPITFDSSKRPTLAVTPTTGLDDGQAIEVRGTNLGSATVSFGECLEDQWASCAYGEATTDADGNFVATFAAHRVLTWSYHGFTEERGECDVDGVCAMFAWVTPRDPESDRYRLMIAPRSGVVLAFDPAAPATTTTSTTTTIP